MIQQSQQPKEMTTTTTSTTTMASTQTNNKSNTLSLGQRLIELIKPQFRTADRLEMKTQFSFDNLFQSVDFQNQAKDPYGNLHPHYKQSVKKGFSAIKDYVELYTNDVLNGIRDIDLLCIKTADRKMDKYEECKEMMNIKVHKQVIVPLVNASALMYKVSNQCLLKGNSVNMCANIVADHTFYTFKLASEKIKTLAVPLQVQVPENDKPAQYGPYPTNNMINSK